MLIKVDIKIDSKLLKTIIDLIALIQFIDRSLILFYDITSDYNFSNIQFFFPKYIKSILIRFSVI